MKKKAKKNKKGMVYWIGGAFLLMIMVVGVIKIIHKDDKISSYCQKRHDPTVELPKQLVTADDWLALGDYDYESGNCKAAMEDLNKAIEMNPGYAEAYNNRGFVRMRLGEVEEAIVDFDTALGLRPNYPHALMNRGDAYKMLGDKSMALANYGMVIAMGKEAIKSEVACGRREIALYDGNFLKVMWHAFTRGDDIGCWKLFFER